MRAARRLLVRRAVGIHRGLVSEVLAVNGQPVGRSGPSELLVGQAGREVELTLARAGSPNRRVTVRATDDTGYTQTSEQADPVPDGATGWHSVSFAVT